MRSVHFPEAPKPDAKPLNPGHFETRAKEVNILEVFANAHRDVELIREKLRGLLTSSTRHGDLQVSISATKRLEEYLGVLIEHEEE